jgi:uncharacterized protein (TIGR00290 family)
MGLEYMAFGDIFLEDLRQYRESKLDGTGISPIFPLWGMPTAQLAQEMISNGLRCYITSIDTKHLSRDLIGREYNRQFLEALPKTVDPCGEHGEFHTFVFDGPMFRKPIDVTVGEIIEQDGFVYADLRAASGF